MFSSSRGYVAAGEETCNTCYLLLGHVRILITLLQVYNEVVHFGCAGVARPMHLCQDQYIHRLLRLILFIHRRDNANHILFAEGCCMMYRTFFFFRVYTNTMLTVKSSMKPYFTEIRLRERCHFELDIVVSFSNFFLLL